MNILIVSYIYEPAQNPRSFRWTALSEYWSANGHNVTVVTGTKLQTKENASHDQRVRVVRVPGIFIDRFRSLKEKSLPTNYQNECSYNNIKALAKEQFKKKIHIIYNWTLKKIQWPDYSWHWILPAKNCIKKLLTDKSYDLMISVSHPFSSHVIGAMIKHENSGLKWIMDIGDPFCFLDKTPVNNFMLYRKLNFEIERRYFRKANKISVTTQETYNEYFRIFPEAGEKIFVIPPLLSIPTLNWPVHESYIDEAQIKRLLFIGQLYQNIRHPRLLIDFFMRARKQLHDDVELHFVGGYDGMEGYIEEIKNKEEFKSVVFHGRQTREFAIKMMHTADWLVNISNETVYQLPSKLVEYVSTGKPILNVCRSNEDSSVKFLQNYPSAISLNFENGITDAHVSTLTDFLKTSKPLCEDERAEWIEKHSIEKISNSYMELIQR